jgi:hypothetical protein
MEQIFISNKPFVAVRNLCAGIVAICSFFISSAHAHHSYVAEFDADNPTTIEGVVKEVWFKSPHIRYYIVVTDAGGNDVTWDTRGLTPVKLARQGWTKKTIQVGDRVKVHGHTGRTNKTILSILEITLPDGRVLSSKSSAYDIAKDDE